jgi:2-polyprenyl-3-methyl-5-hydroxy-6-metoxy-1,4-benzoquinol methylase
MINLGYCPICKTKTEKAKEVFRTNVSITGEPFESCLVECPSCNHVFLNPQPTDKELEHFYNVADHLYNNESDTRLEAARKLVAENLNNQEFCNIPIVRGGRFLDVGCGIGNVVAAMSLLGMEAEGIETSIAAAGKAQSLGRKVFSGTLYEAKYVNSTFDSIAMIHVLEHIPEPINLLQECYKILKPNGILTIGVPNLDSLIFCYIGKYWSQLHLPAHLHHFRSHSLLKAAHLANFTVAKIFTESLTPFVEAELVMWLRRRFLIPQRLLLKTGVIRPWAKHIAAKGNSTGRGEAIVVQLRK